MSTTEEPILHPIGIVSRRTGLKPDLIRAWERRYEAIQPQRTEGRHRLYAEEDIERLKILGRLTEAGHSIGRIAHLDDEQLRELAVEEELPLPHPASNGQGPSATRTPKHHLEQCMKAIENLDGTGLEFQLERAAVDLSRIKLTEELLVPLMQAIGERWRRGELRPMHEHLATAAVRSFIGSLHSAYRVPSGAPRLIVTTPAGQLHELGALVAACAAAAEGWQVTYLGPDLPCEEIVAAAHQRRARGVLLSVVFPADDSFVGEEIVRIRRHLGDDIAILVGGRSASAYFEFLEQADAALTETLPELRQELVKLRARPGSGPPPEALS
ncbi:MAG: MerR family transcriptional regulator [Acidobacteriota bacterium]|nr:MerR family transcriptional regulator [Acidobacteriota bacterium]